MPTLLPKNTVGLYEQPITANTAWTVQIGATYSFASEVIEVINHGATPVYLRVGASCAVQDPMATIVGPGAWVDLPVGLGTDTITIISATDTTVSVTRTR